MPARQHSPSSTRRQRLPSALTLTLRHPGRGEKWSTPSASVCIVNVHCSYQRPPDPWLCASLRNGVYSPQCKVTAAAASRVIRQDSSVPPRVPPVPPPHSPFF